MADVTDVLERILLGETPLKKDLEQVAKAAAQVRREFLGDVARELSRLAPGTPDFEAFKSCMGGMGELLSRYGILSFAEMQRIFMTIEEMER